jgi:hypothetical protein
MKEKILGARLGAQCEQSIFESLSMNQGHILHLRLLCSQACRNPFISFGHGEVYKVVNKHGSFFYIIAGSNKRKWLSDICSQEFVDCIEPTTQSSARALYSTFGTTSEMGIGLMECDPGKPRNKTRTYERMLTGLHKAASTVCNLLKNTGRAHSDSLPDRADTSIELYAIFLFGLSRLSGLKVDKNLNISICLNVDQSKLQSLLCGISFTTEAATSHCLASVLLGEELNPSLEISKSLHLPFSLFKISIDDLNLDCLRTIDQAQAALDLWSKFAARRRKIIKEHCLTDNFATATKSPAFQRAFEIIAGLLPVEGSGDSCNYSDGYSCKGYASGDSFDALDETEARLTSPRKQQTSVLKLSPNRTKLRSALSESLDSLHNTVFGISQDVFSQNASQSTLESYYKMCWRKVIVRQIQFHSKSEIEHGTLIFSLLIPPPSTEHIPFGLPFYIVMAVIRDSEKSEQDSDSFDLFSSCSCRHCQGKTAKTKVVDFFNNTLVLKKVQTDVSCRILQFASSVVFATSTAISQIFF